MIYKKQGIKQFIFRIFSLLITFVIALVVTENLIVSLLIGLVNVILQIVGYYVFEAGWKAIAGISSQPAVIFLTGLSGSGKTTIAKALMEKLRRKGIEPVLLDGDEIRQAIQQTGFDEPSRKKHNLNIGYMASMLEAQGLVVIVALISPYDDIRDRIRAMCKNFKEVYISTSLEVCMARDPKGLYAKAIAGTVREFTGISSPYFPPKKAELTIDTAQLSVEESVTALLQLLKN